MSRKIVISILTLIIIYIFDFFVPRLMPGDAFSYMEYAAAQDPGSGSSNISQQRQAMSAYYGLDKPVAEQFRDTLRANLRGDFGESIYYKKPVSEVIASRLPWTLSIMGTTLVLSLLIGTALAFLSVKKKKTDPVLYALNTALAETPAFLVGMLLLFLIAAKVKWIPLSGGISTGAEFAEGGEKFLDILRHSLMPVSALVLVTSPSFYFTARSSFLSISGKKYMLTAKAKGLSDCRKNFRYILLNALPPIAARFFLSVGACVGATLLVENVFAYPGLGKLMRDAVNYRDYPLIQGIFLVSALFVLVSSLISDLISSMGRAGE